VAQPAFQVPDRGISGQLKSESTSTLPIGTVLHAIRAAFVSAKPSEKNPRTGLSMDLR
jgi:hypothetical protein